MPNTKSYSKVCPRCKNEFQARLNSQKHCSRKCANESLFVYCRCKNEKCPLPFGIFRRTGNKRNRLFCSAKCSYIYVILSHHTERECKNVNCKKIYVVTHFDQKYCSYNCFAENKKLNTMILNCKCCGKSFPKNRKKSFCSNKCVGKYRTIKSIENRDLVLKSYDKFCEFCGKNFLPKSKDKRVINQKTCSHECRLKLLKRKKNSPVNKFCKFCGKNFLSKSKHKKTCSNECKLKLIKHKKNSPISTSLSDLEKKNILAFLYAK